MGDGFTGGGGWIYWGGGWTYWGWGWIYLGWGTDLLGVGDSFLDMEMQYPITITTLMPLKPARASSFLGVGDGFTGSVYTFQILYVEYILSFATHNGPRFSGKIFMVIMVFMVSNYKTL